MKNQRERETKIIEVLTKNNGFSSYEDLSSETGIPISSLQVIMKGMRQIKPINPLLFKIKSEKKITDKQKEILFLSKKGCTVAEISRQVHVSRYYVYLVRAKNARKL